MKRITLYYLPIAGVLSLLVEHLHLELYPPMSLGKFMLFYLANIVGFIIMFVLIEKMPKKPSLLDFVPVTGMVLFFIVKYLMFVHLDKIIEDEFVFDFLGAFVLLLESILLTLVTTIISTILMGIVDIFLLSDNKKERDVIVENTDKDILYIKDEEWFKESITVLNKKIRELSAKEFKIEQEELHELNKKIRLLNDVFDLCGKLPYVKRNEWLIHIEHLFQSIDDKIDNIQESYEECIKKEIEKKIKVSNF